MLDAGEGTLVTVYGGTPSRYPPLVDRPHDDRCGFSQTDDPMAVRRAEDEEAMTSIGWTAHHLPYLDVQYRKPASGRAHDAATIQGTLLRLWSAAGNPTEVWAPAGIAHEDHKWMRNRLERFARDTGVELMLWMEPGYRSHYPRDARRVEREVAYVKTHRLETMEIVRKLTLIRHYRSQLNGISALALTDALLCEEFGRWGGG